MPSTAIDLFCGIGGLSYGLLQSGINVCAGFDIEESCRYAYETNTHANFHARDITTITPEEIIATFPANHTRILVGCAPCQPFSKYTKRYRKDGPMNDKWRLLYYFGHLVSSVLPEIISMENVPELENEQVFRDFIQTLMARGYSVYHGIVYCPDYGVPQHRKRLVLLASLHGEITMIPPTHAPDHYRTVRHAIGALPPLNDGCCDPNDIMHQASRLSEINRQRIRQSVPGGTWRDWVPDLQLNCHRRDSGRSYPSVYGRMLWDEPSPTITTQFFGLGNGRFGHPEQNRALSLREGAILQSFPQNYAFVQNASQINKRVIGVQIGNAVPVELGRAIGISILRHLHEVNLDD